MTGTTTINTQLSMLRQKNNSASAGLALFSMFSGGASIGSTITAIALPTAILAAPFAGVFSVAFMSLILFAGARAIIPAFREWRMKNWIQNNTQYIDLLEACVTYNTQQCEKSDTPTSITNQDLINLLGNSRSRVNSTQLYLYLNQQTQPTKALRRAHLASDLLRYFSSGNFFKQQDKSKFSKVLVFILHVFFFIFAAPILALVKLDKKRAEKVASKKSNHHSLIDDKTSNANQAPKSRRTDNIPLTTLATDDEPATFRRPTASPDASQASLLGRSELNSDNESLLPPNRTSTEENITQQK